MSENKTLVIIVTYNPDLDELIQNIQNANQDDSKILIIDNSDEELIQIELIRLIHTVCDYIDIEIHQFKENKGIACAQNFGLQYALINKFQFILELDQDTLISQNYINNVKSSYLKIKSFDPFVLGIGPIAIDAKADLPYDGHKLNSGIKKVPYTLSSGFFYETNRIQKLGFKNVDFFLDMVDWEWCIRAKDQGYNTYIDTSIEIHHKIGNNHFRFLGLEIGNPSPFRHYYAYRNLLFIIKSSKMPFSWNIRIFGILVIKFFTLPLMLKNGKERLKYMIQGIRDFIKKKGGKLIEKR
jgi:rhamnosyltransferase